MGSLLRWVIAGCACVATFVAAPDVRAQDGGGRDRRVTTTVLVISDDGVPTARSTSIGIGLRRGISGVNGVRYVDPADQLAARGVPEEIDDAIEQLDAIADQLRSGDAEDAARRLEAMVELFEQNLVSVKRATLVDAYMLNAIAGCRINRRRRCDEGFERVLVFREEATYDSERYPSEYAARFDEARSRVGARARTTLTVATQPEGAEVFIDGRSVGPSPATADSLLPGDHYVTIKLLGYEKKIERVTVPETGGEAHLDLRPLRDMLMVQQTLPRIRQDLGQQRASNMLVRFATSRLAVDQCAVAVLSPDAGGDVRAEVYLYDIRSRLLLSHRAAPIPGGENAEEESSRLGTSVYRNVDLTGQIAAPEDTIVVDPAPPLWKRWWFWTAVGVVVVSGIVAIVYASRSEQTIPDGFTRIDGTIQ